MRVLEMTGAVSFDVAVDDDGDDRDLAGPFIGDRPLIAALIEAFPETRTTRTSGPLTVMIAVGGIPTLYRGRVDAAEGAGDYSSLTPGTGALIHIRDTDAGATTRDLYEMLQRLDGQVVHLRIDDGPASVPMELTGDPVGDTIRRGRYGTSYPVEVSEAPAAATQADPRTTERPGVEPGRS